MDQPTAYDYPAVYRRLGYDHGPGKLGCIMLDLEPIAVTSLLPGDIQFYYGEGDLSYCRGPVAEDGAHATLLYGLTPDKLAGQRERESVDELLDGLTLDMVTVQDVGFFPGMHGEPYGCIIAHVSSPDMVEANRRLRFLPHIDTFRDYRPHVSLAYVREHEIERAVEKLSILKGAELEATGINYGG